jgi:uncharacterized membrane protein YfhO
VEPVPDSRERLAKLGSAQFNLREIAYSEEAVNVAPDAQGEVQVTSAQPQRVELLAQMNTSGLVVLTDRWSPGWTATLDRNPAPILRVDHALKGVVAPTGTHRIVFAYELPGLKLGISLTGTALAALVAWIWLSGRNRPYLSVTRQS